MTESNCSEPTEMSIVRIRCDLLFTFICFEILPLINCNSISCPKIKIPNQMGEQAFLGILDKCHKKDTNTKVKLIRKQTVYTKWTNKTFTSESAIRKKDNQKILKRTNKMVFTLQL